LRNPNWPSAQFGGAKPSSPRFKLFSQKHLRRDLPGDRFQRKTRKNSQNTGFWGILGEKFAAGSLHPFPRITGPGNPSFLAGSLVGWV
jgi:hypothetical protein